MRLLLSIFLVLLSSCISREKYAASLREAELAKGRLADQQRLSSQQASKDKQEIERLQQEQRAAEQKYKDAEASLTQSKDESAQRGIRIESLEEILQLWRSLPTGQFPSTGLDPGATFASAATLLSVDPSTKKQQIITSKTGITLSPEAIAQIKLWAAPIQKTNHALWLLGFADGTADNIKVSGEYALAVARAFIAQGIAAPRITISAMGSSGPLCQDLPLGENPDVAACIAKKNRVQIILLSEGF
jgi:outer membrane protein OmpA-like peptidoglycan-associated protein